MVVCLERGADLHMAQLMPVPLAVSCFSKIQIGFTFLVPAHLGSRGKRAVERVCVLGRHECDCRVCKICVFKPVSYLETMGHGLHRMPIENHTCDVSCGYVVSDPD